MHFIVKIKMSDMQEAQASGWGSQGRLLEEVTPELSGVVCHRVAGQEHSQGNGAQALLICRGCEQPPSLETNAEQIQLDPFEGVPNYWLPGKPNLQSSRPRVSTGPEQGGGWGGAGSACLEGPGQGRKWWAEGQARQWGSGQEP